MSREPNASDEDDLLAAELVFGLLDEEGRAIAENRLANDAVFAAAHRRWQRHAVGLLETEGEEPSPSVWQAIASRLPVNENERPALGVAASLRFWRATSAVAAIAASVLAVIVVEHRSPPPAPPVVVAKPSPPELVAMLGPAKGAAVAVTFEQGSGRLIIAPRGLIIDARSTELWVIPADGKPRSLGTFSPTEAAAKSPRPAAARWITPGVTLAVSVEPIGGSRTGSPTGPVILKGALSKI